jgi:glutamyl-tRNA synthetase
LTTESFTHKSLATDTVVKILQFSLWQLEQLPEWQRDNIEQSLQDAAQYMEIKIRDFLFPLFVAMSGKAVSTSVIESISILGLDITRARLRHAIVVLGGISKKQAKSLERDYRGLVVAG